MVAHGFEDRLFLLADGQVFRVGNRRTRGFAQHDLTRRLFDLFRHLLVDSLLCIRIFNLLDPMQAAGKPLFVTQHQRIQLLHQHWEG